MTVRPKDEEELQKREAAGVIRASRFVRLYSRSRKPITMETVYEIHKCIFKLAWPDVAGELRDEELKISDSKHLPPHHSQLKAAIHQASEEFKQKLSGLESAESFWFTGEAVPTESDIKILDKIIDTAAWIHHTTTYIHPFREGNGRTARLAANLVLERYGLIGISIKVERENKTRYRQALAQIDSMRDYEPLKQIIYEGLIDRYKGVAMRFVKD
jgi:fido (protein-threonine AMPylation protein)